MSRWILRTLFLLVVVGGTGAVLLAMLRWLNPRWWRVRAIRRTLIAIIPTTIGAALVWRIGHYYGSETLFWIGATAASVCLVVLLALLISLPVSGAVHGLNGLLERWSARRKSPDELRDPRRRHLLQGVAAAVPLSTLTVGSSGIALSFGDTRLYVKRMEYDRLPPALEGFRVLHLTDSHLGYYRFLDDFRGLLDRARRFEPDLILVTGDIADDLSLLGGALDAVAGVGATYGAYASLGNHEYSRGIWQVLYTFARGPVPLLRSEGVALNVRGTPLYVAGADDPRRMRHRPRFLEQTVEQALADAPPQSFRILMSHRPEGFLPAAERGVELTLAGHTHGGQVGIGGRSFWRTVMPDRYLWGEYPKGTSRLYVSSGMGHWFPFRLGCPPEAPIIELRRRRRKGTALATSLGA